MWIISGFTGFTNENSSSWMLGLLRFCSIVVLFLNYKSSFAFPLSSTIPLKCSNSWLILILSQRQSCRPTSQSPITKRSTTSSTTYINTTPTVRTNNSCSGLFVVSILFECLAMVSRRTLAKLMHVCFKSSLWTTLPPKSALLLL
jgi:hypothetical protein